MCIWSRLWYCDIELQPEGRSPIGPSAVAIPTENSNLCPHPVTGKMVPYAVPRALGTSEIPGVVQQFADGAKNAIEAGSLDFQTLLPYVSISNVGPRHWTIFQIIMQMLAEINKLQPLIILYTTRLQIICASVNLRSLRGPLTDNRSPWILVEKKWADRNYKCPNSFLQRLDMTHTACSLRFLLGWRSCKAWAEGSHIPFPA